MLTKRRWSLLLVAFAATTGAGAETAPKHPAFAVYLLQGSQQPSRATATGLDQLHLLKPPLLTEEDIIEYDWARHDIKLSTPARKRLPRPGVYGEPFVVVADGDPVYVGAFFTSESSASHHAPVIVVDPIAEMRPPDGCIRINRAYPSDEFAKGKDVRQDPRVKACLKRLGKLKKSNANGVSKEEARDLAWREYIKLTDHNVLAEESVAIVGQHTLDFDVRGFAESGQRVWEAHAKKIGGGLRGILWVHASSGKVKGIIGHWSKHDQRGWSR